MKKLYKLLSLVTVLAMLLCSAALAEGADMTLYSATLSDIQMTVDGTPIVDLSGLSVSGGIAMDLAADRVVLQSAVLAGDQAVSIRRLDAIPEEVWLAQGGACERMLRGWFEPAPR